MNDSNWPGLWRAERSSVWCFIPQTAAAARAELGWSQQKETLGIALGWQDARTWPVSCCLPRCIIRNLDRQQSSQDSHWHSSMGHGPCKHWPNPTAPPNHLLLSWNFISHCLYWTYIQILSCSTNIHNSEPHKRSSNDKRLINTDNRKAFPLTNT